MKTAMRREMDTGYDESGKKGDSGDGG